MTDMEQIQEQYRRMYDAMIRKDADSLSAILDDSFLLVHMTGMRQPKAVFIQSVLNGTLNYYSAQHENIPVRVDGDTAELTGQSRVNAAASTGNRADKDGRRVAHDAGRGVHVLNLGGIL